MLKKKRNIIFIVLSIVLVVFIFLLVNIIRLFHQPTQTTIVRNGKLTKYEEVVGYVTREENIIDTSGFEGMIQTQVDDSARVSKGGVIATYVSASEEKLMEKIKKLDEQIEEAMASQQTIYDSDAKTLESSIAILLYDTVKSDVDINTMKENKTKLNNYVKKKAQIVGELSPVGSRLKELITERTKYEKEINDSTKQLLAPSAGLVSYRVDGYERLFTKEKIPSLSQEELNAIQLNANQIVARNSSQVKLVNNFACYITMYMTSPESKEAKLNDSLYLRFENVDKNLIPATIEYISEEEEGRLITVKIEKDIEAFTKYRKIHLDVVWWTYEGLKLHKSLITKRDVCNASGEVMLTLDSVTVKRAGFEEIAYIKILKEFDQYAIVDNYTTEEYLAMGLSEDEIARMVTLKLYSEVVVNTEE